MKNVNSFNVCTYVCMRVDKNVRVMYVPVYKVHLHVRVI